MSYISNLLRNHTSAVIFGLLGIGYSVRALVVNFVVDDYKTHDKAKQEEVKNVFLNLKRIGSDPQIDWDRVWVKVLKEEERIAKEERILKQNPEIVLKNIT